MLSLKPPRHTPTLPIVTLRRTAGLGEKRAYRGRLGKDRSPRHSRHSAQRAQPRERALLVRPGEPAVADDVRDQDRRALAALAHPSGILSR